MQIHQSHQSYRTGLVWGCLMCGKAADYLHIYFTRINFQLNTNQMIEADTHIYPVCEEHISSYYSENMYRVNLHQNKIDEVEKKLDRI